MRSSQVPPPDGAADLFRQTGIFLWHACMRRLGRSVSPARAVYIVGRCLETWHVHQGDVAAPGGEQASLGKAVESLLQAHAPALEHVALPAHWDAWRQGLDDWWQPREQLANLISVECAPYMLANTRRRMAERGVMVDYAQLHDLAAHFANHQLDLAIRWFDPQRGEGHEAPWVTTVFFRYALPRVMVLSRSQATFEQALEVKDEGADPVDVLQDRAWQQLAARASSELARLPASQRQALELYFGFGCAEHTLAQIAMRLHCSVHVVRMLITHGLGALVVRLSPETLQDACDARLASLLFEQGLDERRVARLMQTDVRDIRSRAQQLGRLLRSVLRKRTVRERDESDLKGTANMVDQDMAASAYQDSSFAPDGEVPGGPLDQLAVAAPVAAAEPAWQQAEHIVEAMEALSMAARAGRYAAQRWPERLQVLPGTPLQGRVLHVGADAGGMARAMPLQEFREVIGARLDLYERLEQALDELGAESLLVQIFVPQARQQQHAPARLDHADDADSWQRQLDAASRAVRQVATTVVALLREQSAGEDIALREADDSLLVEQVMQGLSLTASALEEELPWAARRRGQALLAVGPVGERGAVPCGWLDEQGRCEDRFDLVCALSERLALCVGLPAPTTRAMASLVAAGLARAEPLLPGLAAADAHDASGACLWRWRPARL